MPSLLVEQGGISLIEVLVGLSLIATISTVVASLMFSTLTSEKSLRRQTDYYESLRLPGAVMMQDARFAVRPECGWDYLMLYTNSTGTDYIMYKFASWDGTPDGTPDPIHLHRWLVEGGDLQRDDIIGWDMVPPNFDPDYAYLATWFDCGTGARNRWALLHLVKPALPGQTTEIHLETQAFLR